MLNRLQQVPLKVTSKDGLLASLVVLPENDQWWAEFVEWLDHDYSWSIATATNIAWVTIAYVFTLVDSFLNLRQNLNSSGQAVGALWLWLLPLVMGWLLIPICSRKKLEEAASKVNDIAYVATPTTSEGQIPNPVLLHDISDDKAVQFRFDKKFDNHKGSISPIFNYARVWLWAEAVEEFVAAFEAASDRVKKHETVSERCWVNKPKHVEPLNRSGSLCQVQKYCGYSPGMEERKRGWGDGVLSRMFIASIVALTLQWATNGAAIIVAIYTPTTGLGCRSGLYLLYGMLSTIVWALLVISTFLDQYHSLNNAKSISRSSWASIMSNVLRRISISIAIVNSTLIVGVCLTQISNGYNNCYCNSSVLSRGSKNAYMVIPSDKISLHEMTGAWVGSVILSTGCAGLYVLFISLMVDDPYDSEHVYGN